MQTFLAVSEGKFNNRGVLFSLPSFHENIIERTQKSVVCSPRSTRTSFTLFSASVNPLIQKIISDKGLQIT